jgi:hypothetical protein
VEDYRDTWTRTQVVLHLISPSTTDHHSSFCRVIFIMEE